MFTYTTERDYQTFYVTQHDQRVGLAITTPHFSVAVRDLLHDDIKCIIEFLSGRGQQRSYTVRAREGYLTFIVSVTKEKPLEFGLSISTPCATVITYLSERDLKELVTLFKRSTENVH